MLIAVAPSTQAMHGMAGALSGCTLTIPAQSGNDYAVLIAAKTLIPDRFRAGNLIYRRWSRSFTGANDHKIPMIVSPQLQLDAHASGHQEPHTTLRF